MSSVSRCIERKCGYREHAPLSERLAAAALAAPNLLRASAASSRSASMFSLEGPAAPCPGAVRRVAVGEELRGR